MPVVVMLAEERSAVQGNMPSYLSITHAFQAARLAGNEAARGDWIGTGPRVTRTSVIGERFATYACWLYGWPSAGPWDTSVQPQPALVSELKASLQGALSAVSSGWQQVVAMPYAPNVNGPLSWWAGPSAMAQVTQTRDEIPDWFGRLDATENPSGPTTDLTHPTTPGQATQRASTALDTGLKWTFGLLIGGALVYGGANYVINNPPGKKK